MGKSSPSCHPSCHEPSPSCHLARLPPAYVEAWCSSVIVGLCTDVRYVKLDSEKELLYLDSAEAIERIRSLFSGTVSGSFYPFLMPSANTMTQRTIGDWTQLKGGILLVDINSDHAQPLLPKINPENLARWIESSSNPKAGKPSPSKAKVLSKENASLKNMVSELNEQVKHLTTEVQTLKEEVLKLNVRCEESDEKVEKLEARNLQLEEKAMDWEDRFEKSEKRGEEKSEEWEVRFDESQRKVEDLRDAVDLLSSRKKADKTSLQDALTTVAQLKRMRSLYMRQFMADLRKQVISVINKEDRSIPVLPWNNFLKESQRDVVFKATLQEWGIPVDALDLTRYGPEDEGDKAAHDGDMTAYADCISCCKEKAVRQKLSVLFTFLFGNNVDFRTCRSDVHPYLSDV